MADIYSKTKRSQIMSGIRSTCNKATEMRLISIYRKYRITGWRRNYPIFGRPDFVFPNHKLAVFVDGCFWHGCPKHATQPAENAEFWRNKISTNKKRDRLVSRLLRKQGWNVLRIWQHDLTKSRELSTAMRVFKRLAD